MVDTGKNKTLGNECASIIHVLHTTSTRALKLALTATLWNLSALAENRGIIVKEKGLDVLTDLVKRSSFTFALPFA